MVWVVRGVVALQLVVLFLGSLSPHAEGVNAVHLAPSPSPLLAPFPKPPSPPLLAPFPKPPSPLLAPFPKPRATTLDVAVEGVIYCKSCKLPGYDKTLDASPLPGVEVKVQCITGKTTILQEGKTDGRGYFLITVPKVPTYVINKCMVLMVSLPPSCNKPVFPKDANTGTPLKFERFVKSGSTVTGLYTAGFFEFAPANPTVCPHLP